MHGHKIVGNHSVGHKSIALHGVGNKFQPQSKTPSTFKLHKEPEIVNTYNNQNTHKQPIKNFIKKF
jgi:dihydroorotate dehydrogenase